MIVTKNIKQFDNYLSVFQRHDLGELCSADDGVVWDDLPVGVRVEELDTVAGRVRKVLPGLPRLPEVRRPLQRPHPRAGGIGHLDEDIGHVEFLKWNKNENVICLQALSSLFLESFSEIHVSSWISFSCLILGSWQHLTLSPQLNWGLGNVKGRVILETTMFFLYQT